MATFASLFLGWEGFLSFCVMSTAGLANVLLPGMDAFERFLTISGTVTLERTTVPAEGRFEALWPLYGTGPPASGP
jgi:hypothetical protein